MIYNKQAQYTVAVQEENWFGHEGDIGSLTSPLIFWLLFLAHVEQREREREKGEERERERYVG